MTKNRFAKKTQCTDTSLGVAAQPLEGCMDASHYNYGGSEGGVGGEKPRSSTQTP